MKIKSLKIASKKKKGIVTPVKNDLCCLSRIPFETFGEKKKHVRS